MTYFVAIVSIRTGDAIELRICMWRLVTHIFYLFGQTCPVLLDIGCTIYVSIDRSPWSFLFVFINVSNILVWRVD